MEYRLYGQNNEFKWEYIKTINEKIDMLNLNLNEYRRMLIVKHDIEKDIDEVCYIHDIENELKRVRKKK